mmetsp:Transcript_3855/g.11985  ORF Transcript_3855/g.11985 Transcript_3855/m.11985 type:complete len:148 (-) Transcript_3855:171-614(-)
MARLEALPHPARDAVARFLPLSALRRLPQVSDRTLAALKELRLPLGQMRTRKVETAVRQAHALRRGWELGTLSLFHVRETADLSALASCTKLHTLNFTACRGVTDLSALANCAALRTLEIINSDFTDVSHLRTARHCNRSTSWPAVQ